MPQQDFEGVTRNQQEVNEDVSIFEHIHDGFPLLQSSDVREKLLQWNLDRSLQLHRFRVKQKITDETEEALIAAFLQDPIVLSHLKLDSLSARKNPIQFRRLRTTVTSLSFFDMLTDAGLIAVGGSFRRCLDEIIDGATASDLVKEALINPESENADVFTENVQNEFIFQIFRALIIGGSLCQSDEMLEPYLNIVKQLYKYLVSVKRNAVDNDVIDVTSHVYQVNNDEALFPTQSPFHTCFVVVDAKKRWVTVWHNAFSSFW